MAEGIFSTPEPINEPIKSYAPGTPERAELKAKLAEMRSSTVDIPVVVDGKAIFTGKTGDCICPHEHGHVLGTFHKAGADQIKGAIEAARRAAPQWAAMSWHQRAAIFLKAAELLAGSFRSTLNAATMLGQSKNAYQAEIDSACELIDFWRFNAAFMEQIYSQQPLSAPGVWNRMEHRPLEGFVFAITPFNFTSIAGNLPTAPALMGNTVLWKPASTSMYSAHFIMEILRDAGLPDGVINMIPGSGVEIASHVLPHPDLAGIHFTGSTGVFQDMWTKVGANIASYRNYPRVVGETGGKDFVIAHSSADAQAVAVALLRGSFEYQGQKCSAASRAYIPKSLWSEVREGLLSRLSEVKMGGVEDFSNFVNAVIDASSFKTIKGYIDDARASSDSEIIFGGTTDDSVGYFIEPTVILTTNPRSRTMVEEIFGPVLTIYVFDDADFDKALELVDTSTTYALTGALFARDRAVIAKASEYLQNAAGNYYINDKPTGAVVGQQPFGGARASGTNDKAGSMLNLLRWTNPRTIKETFCPPKDWRYPFLEAE
ncbi:MAG: 1-pyrroline-5-carboxylate dehydrogenase [Candidatus Wallbacteria bacterium HGW-Wallbacteria-1]|jgi:1-pyrroline-5-carboxylate dehydrogenase|uniref:L-glutamate gamma-semialdehyde dehydrogenase n=1 Tax=Candidatus Wallbacteria bacterium HGW-Wallbacteria-1 TaxID=2013854 RepID=A0A2N1PUB2_9BACT|nr:MAG: 1-pyrroline-5-carboxylate dehydrogenase [Candidatus Wallbacteria bacterium HGW-Wallbacteria-1]